LTEIIIQGSFHGRRLLKVSLFNYEQSDKLSRQRESKKISLHHEVNDAEGNLFLPFIGGIINFESQQVQRISLEYSEEREREKEREFIQRNS
jgi:hypothetical protein